MLTQIAGVDELEFEIEIALEEQRGIMPLPFPKMDSMLLKRLIHCFLAFHSLSLSFILYFQ